MSHTASGEWQSFETRMRRRRAERMALRAEVAAEAGCLEDARTCLAEARALAPTLPAVSQAERILASALEGPRGAAHGGRTVRYAIGGTAAAMLIGGVLFLPKSPGDTERLVSRPVRLSIRTPAASVSGVVVAASAPAAEFLPAHETTADALPAAPRATDLAPPAAGAGLPLGEVSMSPSPPAPTLSLESVSAPNPSPISGLVEPMGVPAEPVVSPAAAAAPPAAPPPPAAEAPQEPLVRGVLNAYASAYSRLDAEAAKRVWPGVNRAALSRAFDGLASQEVSLGNCAITVTGSSAHAECAGSATWSPRIGAGEKTETRRWTFELARSGSDWRIASARVQNR